MPETVTRPDQSYLSTDQVRHLLQFVNQLRVGHANGRSNMEAYDIRAHMNRIFGFGRWSGEAISMDLVYEGQTTIGKQQNPGYDVCYKAGYRITVNAPDGTELARYTEYAVGAQKMGVASRGDCHDFAMKTAESQALKRAATNLGDQFGLGLYNKGSLDPIVMGTLLWPTAEGAQKLPEVTKQLAEDTDPDAVPEVQRDQEPAPRMQQEVGEQVGAYSPVRAEAGGSGFYAQEPPPPAQAPSGAWPTPEEDAQALLAQKTAQSPVQKDILELHESIGFLDVAARGKLSILWKRANLTPLAHISTDAEIAAAWELYGQVIQPAEPGPVDNGGEPPAALDHSFDAAAEARRIQVEQAQRAFYGNRDPDGSYNPGRNPGQS